MSHFLFLTFIASLFHFACAYVDFGAATLPYELPTVPTPRPNQLPTGSDLRYEILPSMITAVAPSISFAANGTRQTMYSLHYHHYFSKTRQGKGLFKRGVFSGDPPTSTCTPCGGNATASTTSRSTTSTLSCSTHTYDGVFRSPDPALASSTSYCYDSSYSGVFEPTSTSTSTIPCCFTIPASCLRNSSTTTSMTYSSGVFRSSTTSTSTTSRYSLSTPSSTSSGPSSSGAASPILYGTSSSSSMTPTSSSSVLSSVYASRSSSSTSMTTSSYTIIVVSSTTITLRSSSTTIGGGKTQTTLTVITGPPSTTSSASYITTVVSNTIAGCGTAMGSGIFEGTGTIYTDGISIVSSGTASGYASSVVGCGTITATSGTFTGSATIIGCGSGSGSGTLTGTGTVWPAMGMGLSSIVSSGIVSGSGSFSGCGTLTGSGTFVATGGSTTTILAPSSSTPSKTTISVFVSYCPTPMYDMPLRMGNTSTSPANMDGNSNYTVPTHPEFDNPLCNQCPNSGGICCPPTVDCSDQDGKCPTYALENSGNTINGYLIAQVMNSTADVAGRKKQRARVRSVADESAQDRARRKELDHVHVHKRKHRKQF